MGVTHHLLGIGPQKHSRSSLQLLKTHFGVNSPLFQLKHPVLFSCNVINQLRNISRGKNVGAPYQKMGIWPLKGLQNSIFIQKVVKKTFVWPDSIKERCWESQKPVCKSFSLQYWRKLCFSVFWRCFMGQIPIIWWVTAIFFSLRRFFNQFIIIPEKRTEHFSWKSGELTPKCVFSWCMLLRECFWGQMPNKWWVTRIFLSPNHFFDWFRRILQKKGHFRLENGNLSLNWGPLKKRIKKKQLIFTLRTISFFVVASLAVGYLGKKI